MDEPDDSGPTAESPAPSGAVDRPPPKPWRSVAGLAERPSRMAFSDRLFYWFVYAGALTLVAAGVALIWAPPIGLPKRHLGLVLIGLGVALFCFGGPSGGAEKGYRD